MSEQAEGVVSPHTAAPGLPEPVRLWREAAWVAALLALLLLLLSGALFSPVPVGLGDPMGDGRTQFLSWRAFGFGEWRQGTLPLWNPYVLLGMPFVANLQSAMFYPPNWLCFIMPIHTACNWGVLISLFMSALSTYALARVLGISRPGSCAAAMTYTLAANHIFRVYQGHWSILSSLPWVPLAILCVEMIIRRGRVVYAALGACVVGLQTLAGQPQIVFYTGLLAGLYFILRIFGFGDRPRTFGGKARSACLLAGMFAAGAAIAAIQLFPSWEMAREASRAERMTTEWATQYGLAPENLATLVAPQMFGPVFRDGTQQFLYWGKWNFWETGLYLGMVSLLLILAAMVAGERRRWLPFAVTGLFLLLIALVRYVPVLDFLYDMGLPGFNMFRAPGRALSVMGLCAGIMAGIGFDAAFGGDAARRRRVQWLAVGLAACVLALAIIVHLRNGAVPGWWNDLVKALLLTRERPLLLMPYPPPAEFVQQAWDVFRSSLLRSAALACGAALLITWPFGRGRALRWSALILLLLMAADFYTFGRQFMVTYDANDHIWNAATRAKVAALNGGQPFRVTTASSNDYWYRYSCEPMTMRISSPEGVEPNVPGRLHDFFWKSQRKDLSIVRTTYRIRRADRLLDLANLKYVVDAGKLAEAQGTPLPIDVRASAMPRAFLVHSVKIAKDREDAFRRLTRHNFDFRRTVLLEKKPKEKCAPPDGEEPTPVFTRYDCRGAAIRVNALSDGFLVLSDLYYPGWKARLDGKRAEIHRADYLLRAVAVPAGEHVVEFEYVCRSFKLGAWVSAIALGVIAGCFCYPLFIGRRKTGIGAR